MTTPAPAGDAPLPLPSFHADSGAIRFWVQVGDAVIGASITATALHFRYRPDARDEDPLQTFEAHAADIEAAVRRRVAQGSIEPVMVREFDLR
jgi:hypothetical protein